MQVSADGNWTLRTGDASYDQDHNGAWGACSVHGFESERKLTELAEALLSETEEAFADSDDSEEA